MTVLEENSINYTTFILFLFRYQHNHKTYFFFAEEWRKNSCHEIMKAIYFINAFNGVQWQHLSPLTYMCAPTPQLEINNNLTFKHVWLLFLTGSRIKKIRGWNILRSKHCWMKRKAEATTSSPFKFPPTKQRCWWKWKGKKS